MYVYYSVEILGGTRGERLEKGAYLLLNGRGLGRSKGRFRERLFTNCTSKVTTVKKGPTPHSQPLVPHHPPTGNNVSRDLKYNSIGNNVTFNYLK